MMQILWRDPQRAEASTFRRKEHMHTYIHTYMAQGHELLKQVANKDLLVRIPQAHIAGKITARRAQPERHLQNILCPQSALHHPRFGRESRWLAIACPGHQSGDPFELPPHSFGLYYHFARDPYEIQYLPGQNEVGATAMQWGRNYMVCKSTKCSNWIWTDKVRAGTKCRDLVATRDQRRQRKRSGTWTTTRLRSWQNPLATQTVRRAAFGRTPRPH